MVDKASLWFDIVGEYPVMSVKTEESESLTKGSNYIMYDRFS